MARAISRRPLTKEGQVWFQVNPLEICGGQFGTGTGFFASNSSVRCSFHKSKRAKRGNLPKSNAVSEMGEHLTGKDFHLFGLESGKAILVFKVVENLSSVSGSRRFIYAFTKAHLSFCPVSDVSWLHLLIPFIWVVRLQQINNSVGETVHSAENIHSVDFCPWPSL